MGHVDPADVLPLMDRMGADGRYTGRGITMAFLDSGFFAHADLVSPRKRIRAYQDIMSGKSGLEHLHDTTDPSAWHGMMSTVVAAGNGALSDGRFRGLAPDAELVLVKVGSMARVRHDDIARGVEWVLTHRQKYDIRILNISCGGDYEASYLTDILSRMTEACIREGIVVVVAVGNAGHLPGHPVLPPASVPAVISVGGVDDAGNPKYGRRTSYNHSYGPTVDGLQKPEVVALADWIAAPILPGTPTKAQAEFLKKLDHTADKNLARVIGEHPGLDSSLDEALHRPPYLLRQIIWGRLRDQHVINEHYKKVDGTSFAAPIVSSVVAQMLEANPDLTPQQCKRILIKTAVRLHNVEVDRQGWGEVKARPAVEHALSLKHAR
ncbi:MAG: S8 family serine peptidase [Deltaproteobacteria bacterium]|nr:S8 family serine peptidase [Deltaproteobacteria bacterium]